MVVDPKDVVSVMLKDMIRIVKENIKPGDRSEQDRRCTIFLTDLEKVQAYFNYWINPKKE